MFISLIIDLYIIIDHCDFYISSLIWFFLKLFIKEGASPPVTCSLSWSLLELVLRGAARPRFHFHIEHIHRHRLRRQLLQRPLLLLLHPCRLLVDLLHRLWLLLSSVNNETQCNLKWGLPLGQAMCILKLRTLDTQLLPLFMNIQISNFKIYLCGFLLRWLLKILQDCSRMENKGYFLNIIWCIDKLWFNHI